MNTVPFFKLSALAGAALAATACASTQSGPPTHTAYPEAMNSSRPQVSNVKVTKKHCDEMTFWFNPEPQTIAEGQQMAVDIQTAHCHGGHMEETGTYGKYTWGIEH